MNYQYDSSDATSIELFAKKLIGKTFAKVIEENVSAQNRAKVILAYGNKARKGGLGNLIEKYYFGYDENSFQRPDFEEAGVELKVTPYDANSNGKYRAGERVVITMVDYSGPAEIEFFRSHVYEKMNKLLLVYYWRDRHAVSNLDYMITFVKLFSPPEEDLIIIKQDYQIIMDKIVSGKAHELSESDTMYLGACTKGATAIKSMVPQFYGGELAKKRAFCLKNSYMTYVLNNYIAGSGNSNSIIKNSKAINDKSFEEILEDLVKGYIGKSDQELCKLFGREYNNNKAQWNELACKMLGIRDINADEFEKANIRVKTIRIEEDNRMRESISLAPFSFMELVNEEFEDSKLHEYFEETRLFFLVWKREGTVYKVQGCQLWNMPYNDLNVTVRKEWENYKKCIIEGISFDKVVDKSGNVIFKNTLPNKSDTEIIHIRPHAAKAAYRFRNGEEYGNVERDANMLPNGEYMTTQSFWINNDYILKQLKCLKK